MDQVHKIQMTRLARQEEVHMILWCRSPLGVMMLEEALAMRMLS